MLGAIIGDIVGSRFEFNPTNDYNFELFGPGCSFTDDTICTVAVADAAMHIRSNAAQCKTKYEQFQALASKKNRIVFAEYLRKWCTRYQSPMGGYGASFASWLRRGDMKPYNSLGNGSAMRVSAIPHLVPGVAGILLAEESAKATHNHVLGVEGASSVAAAILSAKEGNSLEDVIEAARMIGHYDEADLLKAKNKFDETCPGTVPVALTIIEQSTVFEDAIRRAVSLGADADTLGAIVGSIAEAVWGIPEAIKRQALAFLPKEMIDVYNEFLKIKDTEI